MKIAKILTAGLLLWQFPSVQAQEVMGLQQLISYGHENSTVLKRSQNTQEMNRFDAKRSKASMLPNVNGTAVQQFNQGRAIDRSTNQFTNQNLQNSYFQLTGDVLLFNGLQKLNEVRQTEWAAQSSAFAVQKLKDDISLTIANYYLQILMLEEREKQVQFQLANTKELLQKNQKLFAAGALAQNSVLETEAQVATDESAVIDIQNQKRTVYLQLKRYINFDIEKEIQIAPVDVSRLTVVPYSQTDLDAALKDRFKALPGVKQAESDLQSRTYALKSTQGNLYPKLFANAAMSTNFSSAAQRLEGSQEVVQQIGYAGPDRTPVYAPVTIPILTDAPFWDQVNQNYGKSFGLTLNVPIFNGLQSRFAVRQSIFARKDAEYALREAELQAKNDIVLAYENMVMQAKKFEAASSKEKAQSAVYSRADAIYKAGALSYFDWNNARNLLNAAQSEALRAKYEWIFQTKVFEYYLGKTVSF